MNVVLIYEAAQGAASKIKAFTGAGKTATVAEAGEAAELAEVAKGAAEAEELAEVAETVKKAEAVAAMESAEEVAASAAEVEAIEAGVEISKGKRVTFFVTDDLKLHIETVDISVPRKRGIGGAHNKNVFMQNDIKVVKTTQHTKIAGVEIIEYQMPRLDKKGAVIPGQYQTGVPKVKTVYDPSIISTDEYLQRGIDAANNAVKASPNGILSHEWVGYDNLGVKWRGYFQNGKIISFYPE